MEQRGSGIGRMKAAMLNHGLSAPAFDLIDGYLRVIFKGPGDNLDCLRLPPENSSGIPPAIFEQLSKRQIKILEQAVKEGRVTTGWATSALKVAKDTAVRDLNGLCDLGLLNKQGRGRGVHYVPLAGQ
jgi:ATP-dependent DNA helicase RecG